jgi:hypothetical protein
LIKPHDDNSCSRAFIPDLIVAVQSVLAQTPLHVGLGNHQKLV